MIATYIADFISIHALAKRATYRDTPRKFLLLISIHALAKRATLSRCKGCFFPNTFQSTPSQRGRLIALQQRAKPLLFQSTPSQRGRPVPNAETALTTRISIHALAKRATFFKKVISSETVYFNPRPRKEGDIMW